LIEDPSTREEALRSTIKEWQAKDRPAAETWVKEQGLDPAEFGIGSK
jgi:hypothetical protein